MLALIGACTDAVAPDVPNASALHPSDLRPEWVPTSPRREGVDSAALAAAFDHGRAVPALTSVVVVRHSRLVGERYYQAGGQDSVYSIRSVTKSVMSLLIGAAIDRKVFQDVNATLAQVLVPRPPALNAAKGAISLEDVLTMTSGFQWNESGVTEYDNWVTSPDEVDYVLSRPLVNAPGTLFNYNSAAVHLLAVALSDATHGRMRQFADSVLFAPLGISTEQWEIFPDSIPNGGAGLHLRTRDMAKVGALVLQVGMSGARPIISRDWIGTAVVEHTTAYGSANGPQPVEYGYLWWLPTAGSRHYIMAEGYGGQFILIVPDLDAVIAATAAWQSVGAAAGPDYYAIEQFLMDEIMPAIHPGD